MRRQRARIAELEELLRVARADADNQRKLARARGEVISKIRAVLGPSSTIVAYGAGGGGGGVSVTPTVTSYD